MSTAEITWLAEENPQESGWLLKSPSVGFFTQAPAKGEQLEPRAQLGALLILGKSRPLRLPEGVDGVVSTSPPEKTRHPVGFGEVILTILSQSHAPSSPISDNQKEDGLALRCPQIGRFYRSASPETPPYVEVGQKISAGKTIGLLEVMKTFTPVKWQGWKDGNDGARLVQFLVEDGADVEEGQALAKLEAVKNIR